MDAQTLSEVWDSALAFGRLISQLGTRVFGLPHDTIKVFLHRTTSKIAFNYGGLLYFNLAYFSNTGRKSVLFWYMVRMCGVRGACGSVSLAGGSWCHGGLGRRESGWDILRLLC